MGAASDAAIFYRRLKISECNSLHPINKNSFGVTKTKDPVLL
jgi:hypothetical protein